MMASKHKTKTTSTPRHRKTQTPRLVFCNDCGSLQLRAVTKQLQELFTQRLLNPNECGICKKNLEKCQQDSNINQDKPDDLDVGHYQHKLSQQRDRHMCKRYGDCSFKGQSEVVTGNRQSTSSDDLKFESPKKIKEQIDDEDKDYEEGSESEDSYSESESEKHFGVKYKEETSESLIVVDPKIRKLMRSSDDPNKPFKCKFCDVDSFEKLTEFLKHSEIHTKRSPRKKPYKCILCSTRFSTQVEIVSHRAEKCTPYSDDDKRELMKWLDSRVIDMMGEARRVQMPFRCKLCTMEFNTIYGFLRHQKDKHGDRYPQVHFDVLIRNGYICNLETCEESFSTLFLVKQHYMRHTGEKPFKCNHEGCDKAFKDKRELKSHARIHEERKFLCPTCGTRLVTNKQLQDHIKYVHLNLRPFQCPQCDTTFHTKIRMEKHLNRIHLKLRPYICEICGKSFADKSELKLHKTTHAEEKKFKCDQCDHVTGRLSTLVVHKRQHSGEKPFKCNWCNKAFIQRISLTQHLRKHHSEKNTRPQVHVEVSTENNIMPRSDNVEVSRMTDLFEGTVARPGILMEGGDIDIDAVHQFHGLGNILPRPVTTEEMMDISFKPL